MLSYGILLDRYTKLQAEVKPVKNKLWYFKQRCCELEECCSSLTLERDKLKKEVEGLGYLVGLVLEEREELLKCTQNTQKKN